MGTALIVRTVTSCTLCNDIIEVGLVRGHSVYMVVFTAGSLPTVTVREVTRVGNTILD